MCGEIDLKVAPVGITTLPGPVPPVPNMPLPV